MYQWLKTCYNSLETLITKEPVNKAHSTFHLRSIYTKFAIPDCRSGDNLSLAWEIIARTK